MYFSVKVPMLINGKSYRPCICYKLNEDLQSTVELLVAKGKATIYEEERFFRNGKLVAKTQTEKKTVRKTVKKTTDETEGF